jgi:beta-lactamase class A
MKFWIGTLFLMLTTLCSNAQVNTTFLENLMRQKPDQFGEILNNPNDFRVQLFYTQIDRDKNNVPHFKEFSYRLNPSEYFYPASTVKMPLAILALDKLNTINIPGVNKSTMMYYDSVGARQEIIYNNPYSINGKQTIEQAIKEIFLVSDNNAANRLFEFMLLKIELERQRRSERTKRKECIPCVEVQNPGQGPTRKCTKSIKRE